MDNTTIHLAFSIAAEQSETMVRSEMLFVYDKLCTQDISISFREIVSAFLSHTFECIREINGTSIKGFLMRAAAHLPFAYGVQDCPYLFSENVPYLHEFIIKVDLEKWDLVTEQSNVRVITDKLTGRHVRPKIVVLNDLHSEVDNIRSFYGLTDANPKQRALIRN